MGLLTVFDELDRSRDAYGQPSTVRDMEDAHPTTPRSASTVPANSLDQFGGGECKTHERSSRRVVVGQGERGGSLEHCATTRRLVEAQEIGLRPARSLVDADAGLDDHQRVTQLLLGLQSGAQ